MSPSGSQPLPRCGRKEFRAGWLLPGPPSVCTESIMLGELHVAPGLLIAMPQLRDPNFDRSVVLMIEHRTEGSFGLVVNRPTRTPVGDLLKSIDVDWLGTHGEV